MSPEPSDSPLTHDAMQFEHPSALGVLTAFLRTGRVLDHGSSVLLLGTFIVAPAPVTPLTNVLLAAALLLGLLQKYFAWRVALDAELFAILSEQPQEMRLFDLSLAAILKREAVTPTRSMASRWQGAQRLLRRQVVTLALQSITVLVLAIACRIG